MMAIFPGFLFRKCYYRGEFTKQFHQSNEFDKLLWNVFFSGVSIGITFLSIYFFRNLTGLEVLKSLSYETINQIAVPISDNKIPDKDVIFSTYKDLLVGISLIYLFACFFGVMMHWLVKALRIDIYFPLFRFKNYWYYYIHGGKILYSSRNNKKPAFTAVDVLCEIAGETKLYSGILSQYTINKDDNNLENIFLTNARALKQIKDETGKTIEVVSREIPGATFCIPYKNVANMNLIYVYGETKVLFSHKLLMSLINVIFFLALTFVIVSLWFDLSSYGITGFWRKCYYAFWTFIGLANIRLLTEKKDAKNDWVSPVLWVITSTLWLLYFAGHVPIWIAVPSFMLSLILSAIFTPSKPNNTNANN